MKRATGVVLATVVSVVVHGQEPATLSTTVLALMLATALPSAQQVYTERFGTRYLTGRAGLKPFDSGLTIAEDRIIVTTSKRKKGFYVEAFSIPFTSITSTEVTRDKRDDVASQLLLGGSWTTNSEYLTIVTEGPAGAEGLVFQVALREGAGIVAKINFAIKQQLKARSDLATPRECVPSPVELKAMATGLLAKNSDPEKFLVELDKAVGQDPSRTQTQRSPTVVFSPELSVRVMFPYDLFRMGLSEALRKRDSVDEVKIPAGVSIGVSPKMIDAPDIVKIIVERDGLIVAPIENLLQPEELTTRVGAKRVVHSGVVVYPCSAFAPGSDVTITAIPENGRNVVKVLKSDELSKLK